MKTEGPQLRAFFLRRARWLFVIGLLGLLTPWPARCLAGSGLGWPLDLAANWPLLWLPLAWLGLPGFVRRWPLRGLAALALLALPMLALPPRLVSSSEGQGLRLVSANLHLDNRDPRALREWLAREPADLLALAELSPDYAAALGTLAELPHRELLPRLDPFGIGLLSRWPLRDVRGEADAGGIPRLRATVLHPGGAFEVIVLHPMPPLSPQWQGVRDAGFASLRSEAADALAVGDFNATPWSSGAARLADGGWRWLPLWRPTWPAAGRGWFGIPIDAVWAHGDWCVKDHGLGPQLGGDHLPVRVELVRGCR